MHKRIIAAYRIKKDHGGSELYKDNVFLKYDDDNGFYVYRYYGHSSKLLSIQAGPIDAALTLVKEEDLENRFFESDSIKLFINYRNAYINTQNGKYILTSNCLSKCNDNWDIINDDVIWKSENWHEKCKKKLLSNGNNK